MIRVSPILIVWLSILNMTTLAKCLDHQKQKLLSNIPLPWAFCFFSFFFSKSKHLIITMAITTTMILIHLLYHLECTTLSPNRRGEGDEEPKVLWEIKTWVRINNLFFNIRWRLINILVRCNGRYRFVVWSYMRITTWKHISVVTRGNYLVNSERKYIIAKKKY